MNFKIYQAYYKEELKSHLCPEFEPLDNTANLESDYREYPLFLKTYDLAQKQNLSHWGYISWKFKIKMPGIEAKDIIDHIEANPGYDIYFFNPYPNLVANCWNVWEHGQHHQPNMEKIMLELFPILGIPAREYYQPMHPDIMYFALYCVGNHKFWNGFLELATKYYKAIPNFSPKLAAWHAEGAGEGYPTFPDLWYFPFIHERLLSTYLRLQTYDLKVCPYHHQKETFGANWNKLYTLKKNAIESRSISKLYEWWLFRKEMNCETTIADNWFNKLDI